MVVDKFKNDILAIYTESLFRKEGKFNGFKAKEDSQGSYEDAIRDNSCWMTRYQAECNINYKQPIGYLTIVNPKTKRIFAYCRSNRGSDKRLMHKASWGIGGHIEKMDDTMDNVGVLYRSVWRELEEEVEFPRGVTKKLIPQGYLNDDTTEIGKVHFGFFFIVEVQTDYVKPRNSEIKFGSMETMSELSDNYLYNPSIECESWSIFTYDPLKKYLDNLD